MLEEDEDLISSRSPAKRLFTMRQSSSRNHRSKGGFRLKHFLQICLLLAICTWLVYQVKHSHDKKRAYEDRIPKVSAKATEKQTDHFDFGRKGLPLVGENDSAAAATHAKNEDVEEEEVGDEEAKRDGEDAIDELDKDRGDDESEQEEEFTGEDGKDGGEEDALFDNEEREDSAQEAREENYKGDDASSAVAHDSHGSVGEAEIEDSRSGNMASNGTHDGSDDSKNTTLGESVMVENANVEVEVTKAENGSISMAISTEESKRIELHNNTTMEILPEKDLGVTAAPALNVSDSSPEHQNSSKLDERSGLTPAQDQKNPVNEISLEVGVEEKEKKSDTGEGNKIEILPRNSTAIVN